MEEIPSSFPCELTLMPAGLSQPHATGHVRELPRTTHAAGDPPSPGWAPQWDEEQGLSEPAQSSPLDINHKFHLHPSSSCSANSPSPVVHQSFCKGEWCPFPSTAPAVQSFPVCSGSLCFEWVQGRINQGPGQILPGSKQVLDFFRVKHPLFLLQHIFWHSSHAV